MVSWTILLYCGNCLRVTAKGQYSTRKTTVFKEVILMVKKTAKRALSVILSIVLMFTTFFIFDPEAYVAATQPTLTNDDVFFYVPEVIYLAPSTTGETGTVSFKWFADRENADNGEITKSVADKTAGSVYFHCSSAVSYIINVSLPDGCSISNVDTGTWTLTWSDGTRHG